MVVISIQVCVGLKVVKDWGLHPIIEHSTLEDIFKRLRSGELEGLSRVLLPDIPNDAEFKCLIAPSTRGPFQSVFNSAKVGDIVEFGKYLKYLIQSPTERTDNATQSVSLPRNAFQVLLDASRLTDALPNKMTSPRTARDELKNSVIDFLEDSNLGWSAAYVQVCGDRFVEILTEALRYLDCHQSTLDARCLSLPSIFSTFSGFNKPENHGHKRKPMEAAKLRTISKSLFSLSEEPWLDQSKWSQIKTAIVDLAKNVSSYVDQLDQQRARVNTNHSLMTPVRSLSEA